MARKVVDGRNGGKLHLFVKGESGNPNGRPRKLVRTIIEHMEKDGIEPVTKQQVLDTYRRLQNYTHAELLAIAANPGDTPMLIVLAARGMVGKGGWRVLQDLHDRTEGRVRQEPELSPDSGAVAGDKTTIVLPGGFSLDI